MKGETFAGEPLDPYALKDEVRRIRAENEKLRAALKPFCSQLEQFSDWDDDIKILSRIKVGDLRAAAAAIREGERE